MLALPAERTRLSPRLDYQVMSLVETLPVVNRVGVGGHALLADTADKAADHPATGDAVNHRHFLRHSQRILVDGQHVTQEANLPFLCQTGQHRANHIDRGHHR